MAAGRGAEKWEQARLIVSHAVRSYARVRFVAANDAYDDIVIPPGSASQWDVLGKLVGTVRFTPGAMLETFA